MQVKIIRAAALCLAVILGIGIYLAGCGDDDKPTGPVEPNDYSVYFVDQVYPNKYFRYNTGTGVVDTFTLPYNSLESGIGISPDGKTMYLHPDGSIVRVSLDSLIVISEEPLQVHEHDPPGTGREVIISPNGQYLALISWHLHIIDLTNLSPIYIDTITRFRKGVFSDNSNLFYCIADDSTGYYTFEINLDDTADTSRHYFDGGYPYRIVPSADDQFWYLYLSVGYGIARFQVYDVGLDSIIFNKDICPGAGDLEITPDDRYVFFSQPGTWQQYCPAPGYFSVFGTQSNSIEREVWTYIDPQIGVHPIGELCVTPDGKHLIGIASEEGRLFDYDIRADSIIRFVYFNGAVLLHSLKCQSKR